MDKSYYTIFPRVKHCNYEPREKHPRIPANSKTRTPISLLRTPTKLTDRVENESDVGR